jgi:hypothetical protein
MSEGGEQENQTNKITVKYYEHEWSLFLNYAVHIKLDFYLYITITVLKPLLLDY